MKEPIWYSIAKGELGTREISGPEHSARVLEYFAGAGGAWVKDDETPWCGAFVGWALDRVGLPIPKKALSARSYLKVGKECPPALGAICVLWRGSPKGWQGHVGFLAGISEDGRRVRLLGGNQNNSVSLGWYPASRVLGYRWPDKNENFFMAPALKDTGEPVAGDA